jgi:hypothetical protein
MWNKARSASASLVLLAVLNAGCQAKSSTASGAAPRASGSAQVTATASVGDPLVNELTTLGKTCKSGEEHLQCPGGANWKLIADFHAARRERSAAVAALATALADADPGVRGLAASVLHSGLGGSWGSVKNPAPVDAHAAKRLVESTFKLPPKLAEEVVPAAVNAALLGGQAELLYAELAKPEHAALRLSAYPYLMTVGRLQAFAKVQELVKATNVAEAAAAAEAPLNMGFWTEPERQSICEWSEGLLAEPRVEVALPAGQVLATNCSGKWLDSLLERSDALADAAKLDVAAQKPLVAMCSAAPRADAAKPSDAQCQHARELLVRVAGSKRAELAARQQAMKGLAKLWPDQQSAQLLKRLQQDANADVARGAREASKALTKAANPEVRDASKPI